MAAITSACSIAISSQLSYGAVQIFRAFVKLLMVLLILDGSLEFELSVRAGHWSDFPLLASYCGPEHQLLKCQFRRFRLCSGGARQCP